ncbi:ComF family protein [Sanguibacter sp. HDW7]|uniref:ComF family protein n=1 Tax=Sanguibacter sp. HDW7 TaxID=2714931 RepID=UPI001F0EB35D|nr:ComF family protein [Sanguibacter sp. HDW7]
MARLGDLVVPLACAGCGARGVVLCPGCRALLGDPWRCERGAPRLDRTDGLPPLPVWALAALRGPVHGLVVAWKDGGRRDVDAALAASMLAAGETLAVALREVTCRVDVVPVPSSPRSTLRRGCVPVVGLAAALSAGLRASGVGARPDARVLRRRLGVRDQAGLGRDARGHNLAGALVARPTESDVPVLVVDDVLTTGATLAAVHDTLARAGRSVLGAVVLAATPLAPGTLAPAFPSCPGT